MVTGSLLDTYDVAWMRRTSLEEAVRLRARSAYLGDHVALARVLGRYKFFVDTRDVGFASHIMHDGYWEMALTQFMARHVRAGMTVLDIGANFGYYSVLLSDLVSAEGRCVCVEANPVVAKRLQDSLAINGFSGRTQVAACAAGDGSVPTIRFFIPHQEPKNAHVMGPHDSFDPNLGSAIEVPCRSIDSICADMAQVDFMKIDAEGAEQLILRGMSALLQRCKPDIILEFNYLRYAQPEEFIAEIMAHYPRLRYLDDYGTMKEVTIPQLQTEQLGEDWLLFLSVN